MPEPAEQVRRMTVAEFEAFVAGMAESREYDLIDGEIIMMIKN